MKSPLYIFSNVLKGLQEGGGWQMYMSIGFHYLVGREGWVGCTHKNGVNFDKIVLFKEEVGCNSI